MRNWFLIIASTASALLSGIIAAWIDEQYRLSTPERIGITLAIFVVAVVFPVLLTSGLSVPGVFAFHRLAYLHDLVRLPRLAQWGNRFAILHLGRGPRYLRSAEVLQQGERRDLVAFLLAALKDRGGEGRRILVLGEPGSGKTTALERLALDLARQSQRRLGFAGPIPILLRPGDYQSGQTLEDLLKRVLSNAAKGSTSRVLATEQSIRKLLDSPRLVLLFDALDELGGESRMALLDCLANIGQAGGLAHIPVIATCRTRQDPGFALPDYESYSILDLSDEAVAEFVRLYAAEGLLDPAAVYERLHRGGFLEPGALGRNPFWLVGLIRVGAEARTRAAILRAVAEQALSRELTKAPRAERHWGRPRDLSPEQAIDECLLALAALALRMNLQRTIARDDALNNLGPWLEARPWPASGAALSAGQVLEMTRDAGLLRPTPNPIEFSHRLVQEYFTALGLWTHPEFLASSLAEYVHDEGRWIVLAIYAGMLGNGRDSLVRQILEAERSSRGVACALATWLGDGPVAGAPIAADLLRELRASLATETELDLQLRESLIAFLKVGFDEAATFLGQLLLDPDPAIRVHTVGLLGLTEAPEALRLLTFVALDDSDEIVGRAAVEALVGLGAPRVVWPMIRSLYATSVRRRTRAAQVLAALQAPEAVNYLLACDIDDGVAAAALTSCADRRKGRLLIAVACDSMLARSRAKLALTERHDLGLTEALLAPCVDNGWRVRQAAVEAQVGREGVAVTERLIAACGDDHWVVRQAAVEALAGREGAAVMQALLAACGDDEALVRQAAVEALSGREDAEVVQAALATYGDDDWRVRQAAVEALAGHEGAAVTERLIAACGDDEARVRRAAVAALAGHEGAEVTQALLAASGDDDRDVRQAAEQALAGRDEAEVVQAALAACGDDDWGVREAAIRVLAEAPASWLSLVVLPKLRGGEITPEIVRLFLRSGERDVMGLVQQIASDDTTQVVDLAVEAAKAVGDGNAWPVLAGALRRYKATDDILIDDVPLFRALALMGPTVRQELKLVLGDRRLSDAARAGVIWALGRAGGLQDPEIIGNLMDSMAHGSALVRAAAAQALREVADVLGEWSRPEDLAILEPEARPYVELLLSLMQGHPLTMESIPLVMGTLPTLTPTAETSPSPEDTDDSVGSVWEHLRELGRRIMYCAFAAGLAALLGGGGSNRLLPILARALYDLPPTRLWFRGAPMSAATAWMSALLAALWIGVPMFLYQSWKFGEPGLFPHERRMARPRVKLLALSVLLTPLGIALLARLLALASRLIRLMPADPPLAFGLARLVSDDPTLRVVWTNRLIGVSLVFVFVLVAMRPLWNYALRQVRARYLIELATRKPVFYWMIIIRVLRRAFIWQTINFIFMAICLPVWVLFYFFVANFIILLFIVIGSILIILILRFRGISPFLVIAYTKLALIARYIFFVSTLTIFWPILIDLVITVRPQRLKLAIQNLHLLALEAFGSEEAEVIRESRNAFAQARQ